MCIVSLRVRLLGCGGVIARPSALGRHRISRQGDRAVCWLWIGVTHERDLPLVAYVDETSSPRP